MSSKNFIGRGKVVKVLKAPVSRDKLREVLTRMENKDDRLEHLIELGRTIEPLKPPYGNLRRLNSCASELWIETKESRSASGEISIHIRGDSPSVIVKGLISIVVMMFSDRTAMSIVEEEALCTLRQSGLSEFLTPRAGGLRAMINHVQCAAANSIDKSRDLFGYEPGDVKELQ